MYFSILKLTASTYPAQSPVDIKQVVECGRAWIKAFNVDENEWYPSILNSASRNGHVISGIISINMWLEFFFEIKGEWSSNLH